MSQLPIATISLDLDNKWSYLKTQGLSSWKDYPSYLDVAVPRILKFLDQRKIKITVFVIGQDAVLDKNRKAIEAIAAAGHEIANHSFRHEPWLHLFTPTELDRELEQTEIALENITGQVPIGFRGPGFSLSDELLRVLMRRGYRYDASTFPTFLGPAARAYTFFKARLTAAEKAKRKALFGKWLDGFQSNRAYRWTDSAGCLIEVPVTTMPLVKAPFHGSYTLFLAGYSSLLAGAYFSTAIRMCQIGRVSPSLLLHPLDFLGCDDEPELAFFPAMNQPSSKKIELMGRCVDRVLRSYRPVPIGQYTDQLAGQNLKTRPVSAAVSGADEAGADAAEAELRLNSLTDQPSASL